MLMLLGIIIKAAEKIQRNTTVLLKAEPSFGRAYQTKNNIFDSVSFNFNIVEINIRDCAIKI